MAELRTQAQKLADELVERGEMTSEEARKMVDELMQQAQQQPVTPTQDSSSREPRPIEIIADDEAPTSSTTENSDAQTVDALRQQVQAMQEELRRLKRE